MSIVGGQYSPIHWGTVTQTIQLNAEVVGASGALGERQGAGGFTARAGSGSSATKAARSSSNTVLGKGGASTVSGRGGKC